MTKVMTEESFMRLVIDAEDQTKVGTLAKKAVIRLDEVDTPALSIKTVPHKGKIVTNRVHDWQLTIDQKELNTLSSTMHHYPAL